MLIVVSPAKSLDYESKGLSRKFTEPEFLDDAKILNEKIKNFEPDQLAELQHISSDLAELNFVRNTSWQTPFTLKNSRQSIYAFRGDVYLGIQAENYSGHDLNFAQKHLRILSGLYGLLRPLDLMQAYRLEMGTPLKNARGKNLYEFWGSKLSEKLNSEFLKQKRKVLINLASNEYFSAIQTDVLDAEIITPVFKDYSNGKYKIVSFFAKKARGLMVSHIVKNRITSPSNLKHFDGDGYRYCEEQSTKSELVFLRKKD